MLLLALPWLASSPIACGDPACNPGHEEVQLLDELSAEQVHEVVLGYGLDGAEAITCEMMCLAVYQSDRGWEWLDSIESCTLDLDFDAYEQSVANDNLEASVGTVACTGEGIEYLCE